jgi:hypothetical protein
LEIIAKSSSIIETQKTKLLREIQTSPQVINSKIFPSTSPSIKEESSPNQLILVKQEEINSLNIDKERYEEFLSYVESSVGLNNDEVENAECSATTSKEREKRIIDSMERNKTNENEFLTYITKKIKLEIEDVEINKNGAEKIMETFGEKAEWIPYAAVEAVLEGLLNTRFQDLTPLEQIRIAYELKRHEIKKFDPTTAFNHTF